MEEQSSQLVSEHEVVDVIAIIKTEVKWNNKKNMIDTKVWDKR